MKSSKEFVVGKHNIGWLDSDFTSYFKDTEFKKMELPTAQKLPRYMSDSEIESELTPGICTLGDVLALLDSDVQEYKDGNWNLFYTPTCVVHVHWFSGRGRWGVRTWRRGDGGWSGGGRVFSPAIDSSNPKTFSPSETLPLELIINGMLYKRVNRK